MALKIKVRASSLSVLIYLLLFGAHDSMAQNAKAQIEAGINELKQTVSQMKVDDAQAKDYLRLVNRAEAALQSNYRFLSLVYLQQAWMNIQPEAYHLAKAEIAKQGVTGFDQEWKKVAGQWKSKDRLLNAKGLTLQPAAAKAVMETALTLIQPYHQSSRLYALNADVSEALIYLGRAQAAMDFALFCTHLDLPLKGSLIKSNPIVPELKDLEAKIVEAYKQPDAASKQRAFIQISVTLKMAEELNRERRFSGALLRYLDALLELTVQQTPAPDEQKLSSLKSQCDRFRERLLACGADASLGLIYAEMAEFLLNQGSTSEENLRRAAAVIEKILPAYFNITANEK